MSMYTTSGPQRPRIQTLFIDHNCFDDTYIDFGNYAFYRRTGNAIPKDLESSSEEGADDQDALPSYDESERSDDEYRVCGANSIQSHFFSSEDRKGPEGKVAPDRQNAKRLDLERMRPLLIT